MHMMMAARLANSPNEQPKAYLDYCRYSVVIAAAVGVVMDVGKRCSETFARATYARPVE